MYRRVFTCVARWSAYERRTVARFTLEGETRAHSCPMLACTCGATVVLKRIAGFKSEHPCDARCTGARGHDCECSCGGKNHGADYALPTPAAT